MYSSTSYTVIRVPLKQGLPLRTPGRISMRSSLFMVALAGGDMTRCVVPSRQGVLSLSTTCPAALVCTRSLADISRILDNVLRRFTQ